MKQLLIIGARGFGREIYFNAMECKGYETEFTLKGFLDDKADALEGLSGYAPILGPVEDYVIQPDDVFFCALGDVNFKRHYIELVKAKGGIFQSLIHSSAIIYNSTHIGEGCLIFANVHITADIRISDYVTVCGFSTIGHDARIGQYSHLGAYSFLGGHSELGESVTLHPRASILPHKKVGSGATVGAGSVVMRNVKPGTTVFGLPAKLI